MKHLQHNKYKTQLVNTPIDEGKSIEEEIREMLANNTPISTSSPIIYTPRKEGVKPEYDIRTDRFDLAMDANEKYIASKVAKREEIIASQEPNEQQED